MFNFSETGQILSLKDGIAIVSGLKKVTSGEMVYDICNNMGIVLNLNTDTCGIIFLSDKNLITGSLIYRTSRLSTIKTGTSVLSNVMNSLGEFLNELNILRIYNFNRKKDTLIVDIITDLFSKTIKKLVEVKAPGIIVRQSIYESVNTGIKVLDCLIPLGRGQRELVIGDRQTGKTTVGFDAILNASASIL